MTERTFSVRLLASEEGGATDTYEALPCPVSKLAETYSDGIIDVPFKITSDIEGSAPETGIMKISINDLPIEYSVDLVDYFRTVGQMGTRDDVVARMTKRAETEQIHTAETKEN